MLGTVSECWGLSVSVGDCQTSKWVLNVQLLRAGWGLAVQLLRAGWGLAVQMLGAGCTDARG